MRHKIYEMVITVCLLLATTTALAAEATTPGEAVDLVNPLIGTSSQGFVSEQGAGGTQPGVGTPFAMTVFVPQTGENKISRMTYYYDDKTICGFLATHQPTVWMGDYGYVSVMPEVGPLKVLPKDRALPFSHQQEVSHPNYYSVMLAPGSPQSIRGEIAAASRCGMFRFTFPQTDEASLVIQGINLDPALADWANILTPRLKTLKGYVKIDPEHQEVTGYNPDRQSSHLGPPLPNFKGYFIIQFDRPFASFGTWSGENVYSNSLTQSGTVMGAFVRFKTQAGEVVKVRVATSFISLEQARANLQREVPDWDFDKLVQSTRTAWEQALSRLQLEGGTKEQQTIFYTALYHCLLLPREFSEYGRYYSAFDDKVHAGVSYNDYSLWDTFRAEHPLLIFIQPERVNGMIASLVQMYEEGGWLPKWPNPTYTGIMIGSHADAVIADAYVKGFRGYDINQAYAAMRKDAFVPPDYDTHRRWGDRDPWTSVESRGGLTYYHSLGYVPVDKTAEAASRTVEFCYDDFCVAQVAKDLGKTYDYERLMAFSQNYRNLYNPETGFIAPRQYNSQWGPKPHDGFTEGTEWDFTFGALHDVPGMIKMMGGDQRFAAKLDQDFAGNHYRQDNEPGQHFLYLYDYCGQPWKAQELIRAQTRANYRDDPIGINGNDDCGQMSAWYLFGVMGFYPVTPASGVFAIGAPQFPKITLQLLKNGGLQPFEIIAHNLSDQNLYVQSVALDGRAISRPFLTYLDIMNGHRLEFQMGAHPNYDWK